MIIKVYSERLRRALTVMEVARMVGYHKNSVHKKLKSGMSVDDILQGKVRPHGRRFVYKGNEYTVQELSDMCDINVATLNWRIRNGWPIEKAVEMRTHEAPPSAPPPKRQKLPDAKTPEDKRRNAAMQICRIIAFRPEEWDFRCIVPMIEYVFESDLLLYTVRFLTPDRAQLTAFYKEKRIPSDLCRLYSVDGEEVKEIWE